MTALSSLLLGSTLCAAELINLEVDFESDNYQSILKKTTQSAAVDRVLRETGNHALSLTPGAELITPFISYSQGEIVVSFDFLLEEGCAPKDLVLKLMGFAGDHETGIIDIVPEAQAGGWVSFKTTVDLGTLEMNRMRFVLVNQSTKAKIQVDNLFIYETNDAKNAVGDVRLQHVLGRDSWFMQTGKDWDNIGYDDPTGKAVINTEKLFPYQGNVLHFDGSQTVRSAIMPYDGETLVFATWFKCKDIKRAPNAARWASCGVQIVLFDDQNNVLGHRDLTPLNNPETCEDWAYFTMTIPENSLSRQVKGVGMFMRGFGGVTGDTWFAAPQFLMYPTTEGRMPVDIAKGTVTVDPSKPEAEIIHPVWEGTDLWMTSVMNLPKIRETLKRFRADGNRDIRLREFLQGWGLYKGVDASGEPILDYSKIDEFMDFLVKDLDFRLTVTIESTPHELASVPSSNPKEFRNTSTPTDIALWGKIVERLVGHWVDRYGKDTVGEWYFECWNEPEANFFSGTDQEFLEVFDAYMTALLAVEKSMDCRLKIGTPSSAGDTRVFAKRIREYNEKHPGSGARLDVLSFHIYGGFSSSFDIYQKRLTNQGDAREAYPELAGIPVIVTEYGGDSMSNQYHDTREAAALNVKINREYLDQGVDKGFYFQFNDYPWPRLDEHFFNNLGIFTRTGIAKSVYYTFVLMNKMRDMHRIPLERTSEPYDGIAAVAEDGTVRVLLTTFCEEQLGSDEYSSVTLVVPWSSDKEPKVMLWVLNDDNDPKNYYQQLGSPTVKDQPNLEQEIDEKCAPKAEDFKGFKFENGNIVIDYKMQLNSVALFEILP